jgi:hypothetical protein
VLGNPILTAIATAFAVNWVLEVTGRGVDAAASTVATPIKTALETAKMMNW